MKRLALTFALLASLGVACAKADAEPIKAPGAVVLAPTHGRLPSGAPPPHRHQVSPDVDPKQHPRHKFSDFAGMAPAKFRTL